MTQLEEDMEKLVDDVVTKKDLKAAFMIMSEVTGAIAVFGVLIAALTFLLNWDKSTFDLFRL